MCICTLSLNSSQLQSNFIIYNSTLQILFVTQKQNEFYQLLVISNYSVEGPRFQQDTLQHSSEKVLPHNVTGCVDLIAFSYLYSLAHVEETLQLFWNIFPSYNTPLSVQIFLLYSRLARSYFTLMYGYELHKLGDTRHLRLPSKLQRHYTQSWCWAGKQ